jgi:hypothetical protein
VRPRRNVPHHGACAPALVAPPRDRLLLHRTSIGGQPRARLTSVGRVVEQPVWRRPDPALLRLRRRLALLLVTGPGLLVTVALLLLTGAAEGVAGLVCTGVLTGLVLVAVERRCAAWGYLEREDDLLVRRGVLVRRTSVVPYGRMQYVDVTAGPWRGGTGWPRSRCTQQPPPPTPPSPACSRRRRPGCGTGSPRWARRGRRGCDLTGGGEGLAAAAPADAAAARRAASAPAARRASGSRAARGVAGGGAAALGVGVPARMLFGGSYWRPALPGDGDRDCSRERGCTKRSRG